MSVIECEQCTKKVYYPLEVGTPTNDCGCQPDGSYKPPFNFIPDKYVDTLQEARRYNCSLVFVKDHQAIFYIDGSNNERLVTQYDVYEDDHAPQAKLYFGATVYDFKNSKVYKYNNEGKYMEVK